MLKSCIWPENRSYKTGSAYEPTHFYLDGLMNSKELNLLLGYFSYAVIQYLSKGFAIFLTIVGKLRLVINHCKSSTFFDNIQLLEQHPDLFRKAKYYENQKDGFTWNQGESLTELADPSRVENIEQDFLNRHKNKPKSSLLLDILDDSESEGCASCFI